MIRRCTAKLIVLSVVIALSTLIADMGCPHKDNIVANEISGSGADIDIRIRRNPESPAGVNNIEALIDISGYSSAIDKIVYTISGRNFKTDSIIYSEGQANISEIIPVPEDIGLSKDSSLNVKVVAIDDFGRRTSIDRDFFPLDLVPPEISIANLTNHPVAAGDTLTLQVTASDNAALEYIVFSTGGAFIHQDTLAFQAPYPAEISTTVNIVVPDTAFLITQFWIQAEAFDINDNSRIVSLENSIHLLDNSGPVLDVRPVAGNFWVQRGDSLRFWIVARDNSPLQCLGYQLYYGRDQYWYTIQIRDSVVGDFAAVDSLYCAYLVPEDMYCENFVIIKEFGRDIYGNLTSNSAYETTHGFTVEDRIRFSQAKTFEVSYPDIYSLMLVDDRRERIYFLSSEQYQINVYSQSSQEFLEPISLSTKPAWYDLSPNTNFILVPSQTDSSLTIVNIDTSPAQIDTTIYLPMMPFKVASMADGTALILANSGNSSSILRLNLNTYEIDSLELGASNISEITTSGNREYAFIATGGAHAGRVFMYQVGTGVIATRTLDWGIWRVTGNYDGSLFFAGGSDWMKNGLFDNNLNLIDSIPTTPCNYSYFMGAFSRDGQDLYLGSMSGTVGIASSSPLEVEGDYYTAWLDNERPYIIIAIATNAASDRLFFTGQQNGMDFVFWDIPVDPR